MKEKETALHMIILMLVFSTTLLVGCIIYFYGSKESIAEEKIIQQEIKIQAYEKKIHHLDSVVNYLHENKINQCNHKCAFHQ